jgi:hypothetical protein
MIVPLREERNELAVLDEHVGWRPTVWPDTGENHVIE